jgi:hypothetical protein
LIGLLLLGACSDDGDGGAAPTTTTEPVEMTPDLRLVPRSPVDEDTLAEVTAVSEARLGALGGSAAVAGIEDGAVLVDTGTERPGTVIALLEALGVLQFRPVLEVVPAGCVGEECEHRLGPGVVVDVVEAEARVDPVDPAEATWIVAPVLADGPSGIDAFNDIAGPCFDREPSCPLGQVAVVLDGRVLTVPTVAAPSFEADQLVFSGDYTETEARRLAGTMAGGPLPVAVTAVPP